MSLAKKTLRVSGRIGIGVLLTISAIAVLGTAWGIYSHSSGNSTSVDERAIETNASAESDIHRARNSASSPFGHAAPETAPTVAGERSIAAAPKLPARQDPPAAPNDESVTERSIVAGLDEPDEDSRYRLLQEAIGTDLNVPEDKLRELLTRERSDRIRELALQALTERPELTREQIRAEAQTSLTNQSPVVRARAQRIVEQLNQLDRMDEQARWDMLAHGGGAG